MKKSSKIATGIIIVVVVFVIYGVFRIVHGVFWFLGYETPIERYYSKLKTDAALEEKYPGHDFEM